MNRQEILTEISKGLPDDFEELNDPRMMLHFVMKSATDFFEKECGLKGNWILLNGDLTLVEMMKESREIGK